MYFTSTPSLNSMKAIMQRLPGRNQRGGGRICGAYPFNKSTKRIAIAGSASIESKVFDRSFREVHQAKNNLTGAYTVQLADDMQTVINEPKLVVPAKTKGTDFEGHAFFEAASIRKLKGKYYFIYSSRNNHELCYAISDKPDEGFVYGGTIGIINDSSSLVADKRTIFSVIDAPNEQLEAALKGLCDKKIIKYSGAYKRYDFFEASTFDVEGLIKEGTRKVQDKAVIDTLNEHFIDFVLYPNRYNREYKINRIFLPIFATNEELTRKTLTSRFGDYYDGILAIVLANEDVDLQEIALQSSYVERGLVVVHKDTGALVFAVKQYIAIQYLYSKKEEFNSKDPAFEKELQYYADEITVVIKNMVGAWNSSFEEDTFIYYNGVKQEDIHSISDLSDLASRILYEAYPQTLIVNNELINKNTVSGSIMAAKRNVLNGMIRGELPGQYYGVQTLSPDYLAVRSVLVKNGFVETDEAVDENELNNGFQPQREVNAVITRYINAAREGSIDVSELYRELKQTPYGLRDGYLSILFARFLVPHKRSLIN